MKKLYRLSILLFLIAAASCKKEVPGPSQGDDPSDKLSLVLITGETEPGEVVLAQAGKEVSLPEGAAVSIEGHSALLFKAADNQIGFLMPPVSPGKTVVDYAPAGLPFQLELTVKTYAPITNPEPVLNGFISGMDSIIESLNRHHSPADGLNPKYIETAEYLSKTVKSSLKDLTHEEKTTVAYFFRKNTLAAGDFKSDSLNPDFYTKKESANWDAAKSLGIKVVKCVVSATAGVSILKTSYALFIIPTPTFVEKVAAVATTATGFILFCHAISQLQEAKSLVGVAVNFDKLFEGKKQDIIGFYPDKSMKLITSAEYRTLNINDKNSPAPLVSNFFGAVETLEDTYNKTVEIINIIKSWFPGNSTELPPLEAFPQQSKTKVLPMPAEKLSITGISHPGIQLTPTRSNGELLLKASGSVQEETPFTFTLKYTDEDLGVVLEKEVEAVLKPVPQSLSLLAEGATHQVGKGGRPLAHPFKVKVVNQNGEPVAGKQVFWEVLEGKGNITASSFTGADGIAEATWAIEDVCHGFRQGGKTVNAQQAKASILPEGQTIVPGKDRVFFTAAKGSLQIRVSGNGDFPPSGSVSVNIPELGSGILSFSEASNTIDHFISFDVPDITKKYTATLNYSYTGTLYLYFNAISECGSFTVNAVDRPTGIPTQYSTGWEVSDGSGSKRVELNMIRP